MALNYIWIAFFIIGIIVAPGQLIFAGNTQIFNEKINSVFYMVAVYFGSGGIRNTRY